MSEQAEMGMEITKTQTGDKLRGSFYEMMKEVFDIEVYEYEDGWVLEFYVNGKRHEIHYDDAGVIVKHKAS